MSRQMKHQRSDNPYRRAGAFAQCRMYFLNPEHVLYDSYITVIPHKFSTAEVIMIVKTKLGECRPMLTTRKESRNPHDNVTMLSELATWDLSLTSKNDLANSQPSFFWCGRPSLRLRRFQDIPIQIDAINVDALNFWEVINELQRSFESSWDPETGS